MVVRTMRDILAGRFSEAATGGPRRSENRAGRGIKSIESRDAWPPITCQGPSEAHIRRWEPVSIQDTTNHGGQVEVWCLFMPMQRKPIPSRVRFCAVPVTTVVDIKLAELTIDPDAGEMVDDNRCIGNRRHIRSTATQYRGSMNGHIANPFSAPHRHMAAIASSSSQWSAGRSPVRIRKPRGLPLSPTPSSFHAACSPDL